MQIVKTSLWQGGSLVPEEYREASRGIGAAVRKGGIDLQNTLITDMRRTLSAYPGWDVVSGTDLNRHPSLLNQLGNQHNHKTYIPDVDSILVNPNGKVELVISSKGSIQDDKLYASIYHHDYFEKRGIQFWLVTKDTKSTFKSGNSKYYAFLPPTIKIFINNETTYNEDIHHDFSEWSFNDIVIPYPEIFIHFVELIKNSKESIQNKFFNFEK